MSGHQNKPLRYLLQAINYSVFMGLIWYFASSPSIRLVAEDEAMITIAFAHAGESREPCRRLSNDELAKLPPNMRKPEDCPRERSPVVIEALLNGNTIYNTSLQPPGLFKDGGVNVYFSSKIPAGDHRFAIKMDDSVRSEGFDHTFERDISIQPAQILLVNFTTQKGFVVQ